MTSTAKPRRDQLRPIAVVSGDVFCSLDTGVPAYRKWEAGMKIVIQRCRRGYLVYQPKRRTPVRSMLLPDQEMAQAFAAGWAKAAGRRRHRRVLVELVDACFRPVDQFN